MKIEFEKRRDGDVTLVVTRADGSRNWQRKSGKQAVFFALHDLSHFVVESQLQMRQGFYGLLAAGRDMDSFGTMESKGEILPLDSIATELIIGLLETEKNSGHLSVSDFNAQLGASLRERGYPEYPVLSEAKLQGLRRESAALHQRWLELPVGSLLSLEFV